MSLPDLSIDVSGHDAPAQPLPQHEWDLTDRILAKSAIMDYGYVIKERAIGCTRKELIESVFQRTSEISHVWTPETPATVRPEQVPFLIEAFRKIQAREARNWITWSAGLLGVGLLLALVSEGWAVHKHNYLFVFGAFGLAAGNWKYWRSRTYMQEDAISDASTARFETWIQKKGLNGYTITTLACLIVVSIFQGMAPDSVALIGIVKPAVWRGEVWRLFTGTLLHTGFNYLFINVLTLFYLSKLVEHAVQRALVPLLFFVCAVVGSVFSVVLDPHTTSTGASGGIMGLLGFIAIVAYLDRTKYPPEYFKRVITITLFFVALELFAFDSIDAAAHLGGLVAGSLLGWLTGRKKQTPMPGKLLQLGGIAGLFAVISTTVFAVYRLIAG